MTTVQSKRFNITGPCLPSKHYMLPALPRLPDILKLIEHEDYFLIHAPRQSGKTTSLKAYVDKINDDGRHCALYCSLEEINEVVEIDKAMSKVIANLYGELSCSKVEDLRQIADPDFWARMKARPDFSESPVKVCLRVLTGRLDKDLVIFFDEADSLQDQALISFLAQLRNGYINRSSNGFPRSIALIGMRSIEDYNSRVRSNAKTLGSSSPFNIIAKNLTLADFTPCEVNALYAQHTEATGQIFDDEAVQRAWHWSEGQPWLVNALAQQVVEKTLANDYGSAITARHIDEAADDIMRRRDTHLLSLMARLHEDRVKRFIEPMLSLSEKDARFADTEAGSKSIDEDYQYCLDLGLLKDDGRLRPANPIYASVMLRHVNYTAQKALPKELSGKWMDAHGLDMTGLIKAFQKFWAETAEKFLPDILYLEAAPQCLLAAFLQKVVNGGASVIPEYANGQGYADIVVKYAGRVYPLELKLKDNQDSLAASQKQLLGYMDRLLADEGWLVIFDRKSKKSWSEKITWETLKASSGQTIHIVGC